MEQSYTLNIFLNFSNIIFSGTAQLLFDFNLIIVLSLTIPDIIIR